MTLPLQETGKKKNRIIKTLFTYSTKGSSFDHKAASLYTASLHADKNHITLGISDASNRNIIELEQFHVEGSTEEEHILNFGQSELVAQKIKNASEIILYSTTSKMTLIPSPFFDKNKLETTITPILAVSETDKIRFDFIPEIDSYLVYLSDQKIEHELKSLFGPVHFKHHFSSLISTYKMYYASADENVAFVQYHQNKFSLCLFSGKNLIHFNVFDIASYEDIVYYTYYTMEQFQFLPSDTLIHIGGDYKNHSEVLTTFQKYSKKIYRLKPKKEIALTPTQESACINTIFDIQCG